ncbi:dapper homolog 2-like [Stegostoma tigrinum]|uniref:dapper homolog 2-like n=1 Tax=Stegostoma tigrinum TaxID=3053191 RepID=UPI00286FF1A3|nr:dapper homolog 2-like [Stegostoma tigrinum]
MLNRRRRSVPAPSAAFDRCRAGERLQAALAGLQELELLKERQRELVKGALETESPTAKLANRQSCTEEARLEATLCSLKEQLSHLRKRDAGLKIHLQQLDHQISELKLDVNKASPEQPESDSRPSSGFYELSDGGSCSLSTSCTSMSSERTSPSLGSLWYCSRPAETRALRSEVRPRSADELTVQSTAFKQQGPGKRPGGGIRTSAELLPGFHLARLGVPRQRPVSTGDLERLAPWHVTSAGISDWKLPQPPSAGSEHHLLAPHRNFQCDLISEDSSDIYTYPSPLHAVALQSPLFYPVDDGPPVGRSGGLQPRGMLLSNTGAVGPKEGSSPQATAGEGGPEPRARAIMSEKERERCVVASQKEAAARPVGSCRAVGPPAGSTGLKSRGANGWPPIPPLGWEGLEAGADVPFGLAVPSITSGTRSGPFGSVGLTGHGGLEPGIDPLRRTGWRPAVRPGRGKSGFVPTEPRLQLQVSKVQVARAERRVSGESTWAVKRPGARGVIAVAEESPGSGRAAGTGGLRALGRQEFQGRAQRLRAGRHRGPRAGLRARTPPCSHSHPRSESEGSEYSAECASLFHSTVVESSEGEGSEYTANRFGDSESSGSEGRGHRVALVWPRASGGRHLPAEARVCRIKASKALRKKIRRFQPESLKVMTMV